MKKLNKRESPHQGNNLPYEMTEASQCCEVPLSRDEIITFVDIVKVIWQERTLVVVFTLALALMAGGGSLFLPDIYRSEVLMMPATGESSGKNLPSILSNLGGLASIIGVEFSGSDSTEALAVLKGQEFLRFFIEKHSLMKDLFAEDWDLKKKKWKSSDPEDIPTMWDAYRLLVEDEVLTVVKDKEADLFRLRIEWENPKLAAEWANKLIFELNDYMREKAIEDSKTSLEYLEKELKRVVVAEQRQAIFELISKEQSKAMMANTLREFAFKVLDGALPADEKERPRRSLIVVAASVVGFFGSVLFVLFREGIRRERRREERA